MARAADTSAFGISLATRRAAASARAPDTEQTACTADAARMVAADRVAVADLGGGRIGIDGNEACF